MASKKHDEQEVQQEEQNPEVQQETINKIDEESKILELEKQIKDLQTSNFNLLNENKKLEREIQKVNEDYVLKLGQKAKEAQELVNKKYAELEEKTKEEVNQKVDRLIESKFDELLKTIEQLSKIVNMPTASEEVRNYVYGFKMILGMFQNSLAEFNIHQILVQPGEKFDENLMQAFEIVENSNYESGCVAETISNAYEYKNKIIKHAVVKVQK